MATILHVKEVHLEDISVINNGQGSHFFGLTKFHDISMIFPGILVNFQVFSSLFLKYDFQVVLKINIQTY